MTCVQVQLERVLAIMPVEVCLTCFVSLTPRWTPKMTFQNLRIDFCLAFKLSISLAVLALFSCSAVAQDNVDFVNDIKPIFEKHCISCHGPEKEESFRMDDADDTLAYVEPGDAEESDLYLVLVSDDEEELMPPPEDGIPMTEAQIELVKAWINQGADWPEGVEFVDTSSALVGSVRQEDVGSGDQSDSDSDSDSDAAAEAAAAKTQQIFNAIGSLHPAAVHLPIGLLLAAGLFALFSLRGNFVMSDCAYYCLWLGTLGAIVVADLFNQDHKVFWHRTGGLVVTAAAFLLALFAAGARNRDPDDGILWKLGLIVLAGGIGWVGHTGGDLHYPSDHYEGSQWAL